MGVPTSLEKKVYPGLRGRTWGSAPAKPWTWSYLVARGVEEPGLRVLATALPPTDRMPLSKSFSYLVLLTSLRISEQLDSGLLGMVGYSHGCVPTSF